MSQSSSAPASLSLSLPAFRSVLPHEPLPLAVPSSCSSLTHNQKNVNANDKEEGSSGRFGYVHIQGAFLPKVIHIDINTDKDKDGTESNANDNANATSNANANDGERVKVPNPNPMLTSDQVRDMLVRALQADEKYLPRDSILKELPVSCRGVLSVDCLILDGNGNGNVTGNGNGGTNGGTNSGNGTNNGKARIKYPSAIIARTVVAFLRHHKISPSVLFPQSESNIHSHIHSHADADADADACSTTNPHPYKYQYSNKHIQATQVTQIPLPPPTIAWPRVGVPKFRRLLLHQHQHGHGDDIDTGIDIDIDTRIRKIKQDRSKTRFVFMTNIIDYSSKNENDHDHDHGGDNGDNGDNGGGAGAGMDVDMEIIQRMRMEPYLFQDAIRNAIAPYLIDSDSDVNANADDNANANANADDKNNAMLLPPEVFVPSKKQQSPFKYCHIGTRSPLHAQALIRNLQGKQITLQIAKGSYGGEHGGEHRGESVIVTGKLFLDFVEITQRSAAKSNRFNRFNGANQNQNHANINDNINNNDLPAIAGEPSQPQCTSTTQSILVPGLHCIANFITPQEEQVLLACLTGPHAPWAPSQNNYSRTGSVKRRVQHYGYVFDYETSNVLRDRDDGGHGNDNGNDNDNALCPAMPLLPMGYESWSGERLDQFANDAVKDGNGWDALAAIIERVRRHDFTGTCTTFGDNGNGGDRSGVVGDDDTAADAADAHTPIEQQEDSGKDIPSGTTSTSGTRTSTFTPKRYQNLNQMTVNEYKRGQGIGSHIDTKSAFEDGLISLSLGSDTIMEFRNEQDPKQKKLMHLPPRSLLLMSGPARYSWTHQIVTRMTDRVDGKVIPRKTRVSLTLRTAITLPCGNGTVKPLERVESRDYPPKWGRLKGHIKDANNSQDLDNATNVDDEDDIATPETEKNHVHAVYDAIATQWHHTRGKRGVLWPGATQFLKQLPKGSVVADVGCGDGKYFPAIWEAGSYVIGTDISEPLLQTSIGACSWADSNAGPQNRQVSTANIGLNARPAVAVADCMHIPLKSKSCDAAICIAVMHHLSTAPRRRRCLQELSRIVKVGGRINVQAWALEQDQGSRRKFAGTDVFVPFNAQPRYLDKIEFERKNGKIMPLQNQESESGEIECKGVAEMYSDAYDGAEYDERKGLVVFQRYCHMYKEGELEDLVSKIDSLEMVESGFESGNLFVILKVL
jgi:alkylated DNA repair dioxygenase AlkB/SAM-dependent methyltransferase